MQERHKNRKQYFDEQGITTTKYVIPYIEEVMPITSKTRVLEIGCGEGGNLMPFVERGCSVVGVDLNELQIQRANTFFQETAPTSDATFIYKDIYEIGDTIGKFDLIMMRDVIEHIHDQDKFMGYLKSFLKPEGKVFFGYPPWRMPFGGHQQICRNKWLSKLPYFHLFPKPFYKTILSSFGESEKTIEELLEIKDTGISISRFESLVKKHNYTFYNQTLFFINPNYEIKFGLTPRPLPSALGYVPYFKDFYTTCMYCVIG